MDTRLTYIIKREKTLELQPVEVTADEVVLISKFLEWVRFAKYSTFTAQKVKIKTGKDIMTGRDKFVEGVDIETTDRKRFSLDSSR